MRMRGCILYERETAEKRKEYIALYQKYFMEQGVNLELVFTCHYREELRKHPVDFAIVRVIAPEISKELEEMGITVYNNAKAAGICNDKWRTYQYIGAHTGVPFMKYVTAEEFLAGGRAFSYPVVVKSRRGHGGTEVFSASSLKEVSDLSERFPKGSLIVQAMASDIGRDVRVFVVGNRIVASMLRISENDFRSNYCLGGRAVPYELSDRETQMAEEIISCFSFGMAGIDFIFHEGKAVFNEIEDVVGARMLYDCTDVDIVKEYVNFIIEKEKQRRL